MTTTTVDPANWTTSLNPATTDLLVDGTAYYVENANKSYSLTSPSTGVLQFEVQSGDVWTAVDPTTKNRSEISSLTTLLPGTQINVSYGFNLLPGSVNNSSWCVIGQFHQLNNDGNSPPLEVDLVGQKMAVQVDYLNSSGAEVYKTIYTDSQNIVEGHNYAMNIQVTFNANGTGHVVLTRDGVTLVDYTGQMGFAANPDVYWKEGIYRAASTTTMTAQYSNLHVSTGAATTPTAPTSAADTYAAKAGAALSVSAAQGVLANDADHNGQSLTAVLAANGGPAHGTVTLNADGSFTYTPNAGYAGADSFTYIASDSLSTGTPTKVTLNVAAGTPVTHAASYAVQTGQVLTEDAAHGVLVGDTDTNGLSLTASLATNGGPAHGALALNADGSFTYTPNAGFSGTDSFTYIASDSLSAGAPTTVTLNVAGGTPITQATSYTAHAGQVLTEDAAHGVLAVDTDPNGLTLTAALANNGGPAHGALTLNADGSFTYVPTTGFAGTDSFTYIASDSLSSGTPTTVTLNVLDPPPTTQAAAYTASSGVALSVNAAQGVLAGDTDNNGLSLTAALANNGGPAHGTLTLNADGSFTYTPAAGYVGTDSFTYIATDSLSSSVPTTVSLTVGGAQNIVGGTGNDTYYVHNSADQITVAAGTPNETVIADVSYALPANIQNLVLTGSGLTGTANSMNDTLTSTGGPNTLIGGSGSDTFYVNNAGDKVVVSSTHTNDLIVSSVSYALPNNVRSIQLTGTGLTAHANASGGDFLSSVGGGNTLVGSAKGNDTFTVAHTTDVVVVAAGAVNDTVDAYVSFTLPANVQNLVGKGAAAIALIGNAMANVITANSAADTLTGGGGADTFIVAPGAKMETITDFTSSDRIDISAFKANGASTSFHDFGSYSTVSFSTGETIKLLGVHASDLHVSGHYVV
jgi:VCBS repeat-containing protein